MRKEKNGRISMTEKEADDIREHLETLFAMAGALDQDFTNECNKAGRKARALCALIYGHKSPRWQPAEPPEPKHTPTK